MRKIKSRKRSLAHRRLFLEPLERRELLATVYVGNEGDADEEFATSGWFVLTRDEDPCDQGDCDADDADNT